MLNREGVSFTSTLSRRPLVSEKRRHGKLNQGLDIGAVRTRRTMPFTTIFFDQETGELDTDRILAEAIPIAKLIALFVVITIIPLRILLEVGLPPIVETILALLAQFILAVGTGIVLLYIISRAIQLAE